MLWSTLRGYQLTESSAHARVSAISGLADAHFAAHDSPPPPATLRSWLADLGNDDLAAAQPLLVAIDGIVYDLSVFAFLHPGGAYIVHEFAGKDASSAFSAVNHSTRARAAMDQFAVATLIRDSPPPPPPAAAAAAPASTSSASVSASASALNDTAQLPLFSAPTPASARTRTRTASSNAHVNAAITAAGSAYRGRDAEEAAAADFESFLVTEGYFDDEDPHNNTNNTNAHNNNFNNNNNNGDEDEDEDSEEDEIAAREYQAYVQQKRAQQLQHEQLQQQKFSSTAPAVHLSNNSTATAPVAVVAASASAENDGLDDSTFALPLPQCDTSYPSSAHTDINTATATVKASHIAALPATPAPAAAATSTSRVFGSPLASQVSSLCASVQRCIAEADLTIARAAAAAAAPLPSQTPVTAALANALSKAASASAAVPASAQYQHAPGSVRGVGVTVPPPLPPKRVPTVNVNSSVSKVNPTQPSSSAALFGGGGYKSANAIATPLSSAVGISYNDDDNGDVGIVDETQTVDVTASAILPPLEITAVLAGTRPPVATRPTAAVAVAHAANAASAANAANAVNAVHSHSKAGPHSQRTPAHDRSAAAKQQALQSKPMFTDSSDLDATDDQGSAIGDSQGDDVTVVTKRELQSLVASAAAEAAAAAVAAAVAAMQREQQQQ